MSYCKKPPSPSRFSWDGAPNQNCKVVQRILAYKTRTERQRGHPAYSKALGRGRDGGPECLGIILNHCVSTKEVKTSSWNSLHVTPNPSTKQICDELIKKKKKKREEEGPELLTADIIQ